MSVSLLHALLLFERQTAKRSGCAAAEKSGGCFLRYGVSGFSLTSKWGPLGIACSDLRNPLMVEKKQENKRKIKKKRDTASEAAWL